METKERLFKFRAWDGNQMTNYPDLTDWNTEYCNLNEVLLMQSTGLKDKNGKEIYEGDIVKAGVIGRSTIVWNKSICAFQAAYLNINSQWRTNTLYAYEVRAAYEVLGNIHETPELIPS